MTALKRYRHLVYDNARWEGFPFRPDDIVISTPPKCGTTWMQMLCAMLVFDAVAFDRPLAEISPWLDMQTDEITGVVAALEAQQHRRIIKTHTPLDGLPSGQGVTYICVGRDPRDVAVSFEHHMANLDMDAFMAARAAAVGVDDLSEFGPPPGPPSEDPAEHFWQWANDGVDENVPNLASILDHMRTFWDRREDPSIALFYYGDLLADLPKQIRRLADVLGIEISDDRVEEFAAAATFERMKQRADDLVPNAANRIWRSNSDFFHRGRSGQWRDWLDASALGRYEDRVARLVPPDLAAWAHTGWDPMGSDDTAAWAMRR
jgi:aryl sulfotransferase